MYFSIIIVFVGAWDRLRHWPGKKTLNSIDFTHEIHYCYFAVILRSSGVLIGYIVGAVVEYEHCPYIFILFPLMYVFWINALPNTPLYYLIQRDHSVSTNCETFF